MTNILNDVAFYNDIIQNGITQVEETYKILLNNYFIDTLEKKKLRTMDTLNSFFIEASKQ